MPVDPEITNLILRYEANSNAFGYNTAQTKIQSGGQDIFVISDLHLSEGKDSNGKYPGTENFFFDPSFQRYLSFIQKQLNGKNGILVINGDFIDFLRIINVPSFNGDLEEWHGILANLGFSMTVEELKSSISRKEEKYGLKTNDFKSIWRLSIAMRGHTEFFDALANWLVNGNKLVIIKGNHDLEWYWEGVRNYFRLTMAQRIVGLSGKEISQVLSTVVLPNVIFADNALLIDEEVYIKHGHQYDKFCRVIGPELPGNSRELNIPFGSFFNRYFLNQIELTYPYFDNVRPRENILPLLFRERFLSGITVLFYHIPFMLKLIPKHYYTYVFKPLLLYMLPLLLLIVWIFISVYLGLHHRDTTPGLITFLSSKDISLMITPFKLFIWGVASYFYICFISHSRLKEPDSLATYAKELFNANATYRFVIFGHTHNPDQLEDHGKWFYNSGTWIPIVEISNADIRQDKTYTYVHLSTDKSGKFIPRSLQRWNDDAGRADEMILVRRK